LAAGRGGRWSSSDESGGSKMKGIVIYDSSYGNTRKIAEKLKEKQMNQLLPVLKSVVLGKKGPLQEGEVERTKDYARELAAKLSKE